MRLKNKPKMLNNSVIICDSPPKSNKKKVPRKIKKKKPASKTYYESPLKHIQLSSKKWEQLQTQRRLTRSMKKQNKSCVNLKTSLQDSVIILSDNESESVEQNSDESCKNSSECMKTQTNASNIKNNEKSKELRKTRKRKRKSIQVLDNNNTSCLVISDSEESDNQVLLDIDEENIAPPSETTNQGSDDITVVWTSTKNLQLTDQCETQDESAKNETNSQSADDRLFMIDCNPNLKNLKYLISSSNRVTKKRKVDLANEVEENKLPFSQVGMKLPDVHKKKKKKRTKSTSLSDCTSLEQELSDASTSTSAPSSDNIPSSHDFTTSTTTTGISDSNIPIVDRSIPPPGYSVPFVNPVIPISSSHVTMPNFLALHPPVPPCPLPPPSISNGTTLSIYPGALGTVPTTLSAAPLNPSTLNTMPILNLNRPPLQEHLLRGQPREIVIDGNNVAMAHTNGKVFSEVGLKLVIDYFRSRGHIVKAFVPQYRRSMNHPLLEELYSQGVVVFTPSRNIGGKRITPYDDRYILEYATVCGGIVISMDQYRDLYREKPEWRDTIENRLLAPTFVGDYIMFPEDPLGRNGPRLEEFLRF